MNFNLSKEENIFELKNNDEISSNECQTEVENDIFILLCQHIPFLGYRYG